MPDVIEQFRLIRGTALVIAVTLRDSTGAIVTGYDGTEPLTCKVWPGSSLPVSCTPVATWEDPEIGSIFVTILPADTIGLSPGRYRLLVTLDDSGRTLSVFEAVLIIVASPPSVVTP